MTQPFLIKSICLTFLLFVFTPDCFVTANEKPAVDKTVKLLQSGKKKTTIVCFGDSVTGLYYHTGGNRTYTDMLGVALNKIYSQANIKMINAGISGHTTANALARIDKDVIAKKPSLVTVMFGLNDMVRVPIEKYEANLNEIIYRCQKNGAEVILCTPNSVISTSGRPSQKLIDYCNVVRKVAKEKNVALCDTYNQFESVRKKNYINWRLKLSDEIHPNMAGHKLIAESISNTISGKKVSLDDVDPPFPAISKTKELLKDSKTVSILAMKPYGKLIHSAIQKKYPTADLKITDWDPQGKTISQLEVEAKNQVRASKPDLVIIAAPRSALADSDENYIRSYTWLMNWSLSFGKQEWDCVIVHPSVTNPVGKNLENDDLIRTLVRSQDLTLIDRPAGSTKNITEILQTWLENQLKD